MRYEFHKNGEYFEFTNFNFAAHSFGAYSAANYIRKYSKHVKKLIMISPLGVIPRSPEELSYKFAKERLMTRHDDSGFDPPPSTLGIAIFYYMHKYRVTM